MNLSSKLILSQMLGTERVFISSRQLRILGLIAQPKAYMPSLTERRCEMNTRKIPGFTAEASLGPTIDKYQGSTVFGSSGAVEVLPMQEFAAAPIPTQDLLWSPPWEKRVPCCVPDQFGRPRCTYYYVPVWYSCEVFYTPFACWVCHPPVVATT